MENNDKRVLKIELNNNVKHVSVTGKDADEQVVMRQDLNEEDLGKVAGGYSIVISCRFHCPSHCDSKH